MMEKYWFLDEKNQTLNDTPDKIDALRREFGSFWLSREIFGADATNTSAAGLDLATAFPRFNIEFGPIIPTTSDYPPYVVHHQSIKLTAKIADGAFGEDCKLADGTCAYLEAQSLLEPYASDQAYALNIGPSLWLHNFAPGEDYSNTGIPQGSDGPYTSMAETMTFSKTFDSCFNGMETPLNEEDIRILNGQEGEGDSLIGSTLFEYGDFVENIELVTSNLDEKDIPNFYMIMYMMGEGDLSDANSDLFTQAINYMTGKGNCELGEQIKIDATGFTDFLISAENVELSKAFNAYKEYFSLRAQTEFSTTTQADISNYLQKNFLDCRFLRWLLENQDAQLVNTHTVLEKVLESAEIEKVESSGYPIRSYDLLKFGSSEASEANLMAFTGDDYLKLLNETSPSQATAFVGFGDSARLGPTIAGSSGGGFDDNDDLSILIGHLNFSNLLKQKLEEENRTFQQVFGGSTPYSETMAYRIAKYKKSDFTTTDQLEIVKTITDNDLKPAQSVWLANSEQTTVVDYIDSQMKYDEGYVIVVWAYNLVIGTKYLYSNLKTTEGQLNDATGPTGPSDTLQLEKEILIVLALTPPEDYEQQNNASWLSGYTLPPEAAMSALEDAGWSMGDAIHPAAIPASGIGSDPSTHSTTNNLHELPVDSCEATFTASTMPMAVIKEQPFFVWTGSIMDKPPTAPDVKLIPHQNIDNSLLILLNETAGTAIEEPIVINEEDQEIFDNIKESQGYFGQLPDEIEFGADNPVVSYEIYRTDKKPLSHHDFSGKLHATVNTELNGHNLSAASYVDNIDPNIEYYYTFRALDIHGHFSNPTAIFKIQLISDDISVIPEHDIYDPEKEKETTQGSKPMKSQFQIVPKITQAIVNEVASGLDGSTAREVSSASTPVLGAEEETIWGREFKVRLTSRQTKRQVDFNISFGTEYVETAEPPQTCDYLQSPKVGDPFGGEPPPSVDVETASSTSATDGAPSAGVPEGSTGDGFTVSY